MHGFQIWVNLPARLKMTTPRYQEIAAARDPDGARRADGRARVRVIAGEALGARAVIDTHTPIVYQDWSLDAGGDVTVRRAARSPGARLRVRGQRAASASAAAAASSPTASWRCWARATASACAARPGGGRLLLLAGVPLDEPVARYGPFVMNNDAELVATRSSDYQSGRMGEITRTAKVG